MPGDLAATSPVDLCLHLAGEHATGTLAMSGPRGDAVLVFDDGRLAGARPAEVGRRARLGERLVSAGRLDRPDLDAALADQASDPAAPALGRLLIERGLASSDAVRLFVQEQVLETLLEAISWFEGTWDFQPASRADVDGAATVAMPVDRALMEVRRRAAERERITTVVSSPTSVPEPVPGVPRPASLTPDAFTVLTTVDGTRTVAAIAATLGYSYDETSRQVYRLALQGLVRFADTNRTTDQTAAPTEEAALHASPGTGTPAVHLADDGWAKRRQDATALVDEPEPWVGWAHGAPKEPQPTAPEPTPEPAQVHAAAAPAPAPTSTPPEQRLWAPQHEPASTPRPADTPTPHDPSLSGARDLDADTRRALFSELHEVGRANPTLAGRTPAPESSAEARDPQAAMPTPEVEAEEVEVAAPDPAPSLSSSDVSDLLRELHALNLDD